MAKQATVFKVGANGEMPRISNPADFPAPDEPIIVELSTGRVLEMVINEIESFYERGEIPDDLTDIAAREIIFANEDSEPPKVRAARAIKRLGLMRWNAQQVVKRGGPTDRFFNRELVEIWNLSNLPALALDNFRRQQARHVANLAEQQELQPTAEPTATGEE